METNVVVSSTPEVDDEHTSGVTSFGSVMSLSLGIVSHSEATMLSDLTPLFSPLFGDMPLTDPDTSPPSPIPSSASPGTGVTSAPGDTDFPSCEKNQALTDVQEHQGHEGSETGPERPRKRARPDVEKIANFAAKHKVRTPPEDCAKGCRRRCTESISEQQRTNINEQVNRMNMTARKQWYRTFVEENQVTQRRVKNDQASGKHLKKTQHILGVFQTTTKLRSSFARDFS